MVHPVGVIADSIRGKQPRVPSIQEPDEDWFDSKGGTMSITYGALFLLGIAEFGASPVATVPVLLASGALAAGGTLSVGGVVLAVADGGLVADMSWLTVAIWRGRSIVNAACRLSANPKSCVLMVCEKIAKFGAPYIIVGKFISGTAAMLAAAAGLAGVSHVRFMAIDAVALLL